jgi:hypothetical protein
LPDALDQFHVVRPVVAASAAAFHRLDLGEARFPETQHMLRQVEIFRHLADCPERVWTLIHAATFGATLESQAITGRCRAAFKRKNQRARKEPNCGEVATPFGAR